MSAAVWSLVLASEARGPAGCICRSLSGVSKDDWAVATAEMVKLTLHCLFPGSPRRKHVDRTNVLKLATFGSS